MNKYLFAAVAAVMGATAPATAGTIFVIDDFLSSPPNPYTATLNCPAGNCTGVQAIDGPDTYMSGGLSFTRSVLFEALADPVAAPAGTLNISGGNLWIGNDPFVKTRTTLTYDVSSLAAVFQGSGATDFNVIFSDGAVPPPNDAESTNIQAFLNGNSIGFWQLTAPIPASVGPAFAGFAFDGSTLTGAGDTLQLIINGPAGYDLVIDRLAVVPEPGMLGLFGAGAIGLGFARRRKK